MSLERIVTTSAIVAAALPLALAAALGLAAALDHRSSERAIGRFVRACFALASLSSLLAAAVAALAGVGAHRVVLAHGFDLGGRRLAVELSVDPLSLTWLVLVSGVSAFVAHVAHRYVHREDGYARFFFLLSVFVAGMCVVVLAGSIELLVAGWELVGVTSALLISFYQERRSARRHGLVAFAVYRTCDVGLLAAVALLHHELGHGRLPLAGSTLQPLPGALATTALGLLLLVGSLGKSAQLPFSGYLPRAMEGPSPSSAIFYGALSVHAGAYLLLRTEPLWRGSAAVACAIVGVGAATAVHATCVGRVQTDAKSALAYATIAQVGIVYVEIGAGLSALALVHMVGNALLRSFQLVRASNLLVDHERLETALSRPLPATGRHLAALVPAPLERALYRASFERGHLDSIARRIATVVSGLARALDRLDRWLVRVIGGEAIESAAPARARSSKEMAR